MQTFLRREKKIVRYFIAGIIIVALLIGLIFVALSNLRQEAIQTHRHIANLHAYTLEEHFSQTLQHISLTMDRLAPLSHEEPSQEGLFLHF